MHMEKTGQNYVAKMSSLCGGLLGRPRRTKKRNLRDNKRDSLRQYGIYASGIGHEVTSTIYS